MRGQRPRDDTGLVVFKFRIRMALSLNFSREKPAERRQRRKSGPNLDRLLSIDLLVARYRDVQYRGASFECFGSEIHHSSKRTRHSLHMMHSASAVYLLRRISMISLCN